MKVIFTSETKEDFRKHNDYVRKQKKSDGHKYQSYELKGINKSFKKNTIKLSNATIQKIINADLYNVFPTL